MLASRLVHSCLTHYHLSLTQFTQSQQAKEEDSLRISKERDAIKTDLDMLLQQRGEMEVVKSLLLQRLHGGPLAAASAQQEWQPFQRTRAATTITGEGR